MIDWLKTMAFILAFYFGYTKFLYKGWRKTKNYLIIVQAILFVLLGYSFFYEASFENVVSYATYQALFILFIKFDYLKNKKDLFDLYNILGESNFKITIFTNIKFIKKEGYHDLLKILKQNLIFRTGTMKNSVVIAIDNNKIQFSFLFKNKDDFITYKKFLLENNKEIKSEKIARFYSAIDVEELYI